jgi:Flp pilus assembly protein TadG
MPPMIKTHKLKEQRGQTMAELAIVLPVLLVLLLGIAQFGVTFNNYVTLTDAVRAGARQAAVSRNLGGGAAANACRQRVLDSAGGLDKTVLGTNLTCTSDWTPGSDVTVYADYPYEIKLLDWSITSGRLNSTTRERVE